MRLAAFLALCALPATAEPQVVTDIGPVHSLVAQVMAGVAEPVLLSDGGQDPHNVVLRPSQRRALADADLLIWIGPQMTPWLVDLAAEVPRSLELAAAQGITHRAPQFGGNHHDHDEDQDHDGHDHGDDDPHLWLDPANARAILAATAAALAEEDPAHAGTYRANAGAAAAALEALEADLVAQMQPAAGAGLIVAHDAYAHFAGAFGLTVAGALADTVHSDPGAASVRHLRDLARSGAAACILVEPAGAPAARTLAADTGLKLVEADPEGLGLPPGPDLHAALMRGLAGAVAGCGE